MKFTEEEFIKYIEEKEPTIEKENESSKWYLVSTQSNCESKARKNLAARAILNNAQDQIEQIIFPYYEKTERNASGTKRVKKVRVYGNYLFILAQMDEKLYEVIKHSDKITGFVQAGKNLMQGLPRPIREIEVKQMLSKMNQFKEGVIETSKFSQDDTVRILDGVFKDHFGTIKEVKGDRVDVAVKVLGKETSISLSEKHIEKEEV